MTEYKGYVIEGDGTFGMKVIKFPGRGGSIPKFLEGSFTKVVDAKNLIDLYLAQKEAEEDKPAPVKKVKLYPREVNTDATESGSKD